MTRWISDATIRHLREVGDLPELGTARYRLLEKIGAGGMGDVFQAEDAELRRHVAIKVIRTGMSTPAAAERMLSEARITARLEHPGILPVHDVGCMPDGRLYYVMKLVRGKRLIEHLKQGVSLRERLTIFERVCETVAFAHAQNVIHRDLKPQNVMLGSFGEVLVVDWGIARRRTREGSAECCVADEDRAAVPEAVDADDTRTVATAHGARVGTPAYMAPEQAAGADTIDERSDVYALGGLLYFLIAGRAPHGEKAVEQLSRGIAPVVPSLRSVAAETPKQLASSCASALHAEPARRYASAEAIRADVRRFLDGDPVSVHREGILERLLRLLSKYRTAVLLVVTYLVVRSVLLFWEGR